MWKDGKPEPFENLKQEVKVAWGQLKGENHCGFIDRLHKNWRDLEQETKRELSKLKEARTPIPIGDDGEVEYVDFVWKERNVHCETFRNVELNGSKEAFQSNKILSGFDEKMAEYDKSMFENVRIRAELAPYLVANEATEKKLESSDHIKDLITTAYEDMNNLTQDEWKDKIEDGKNFLKVDEVKGFRVKKALYMKRYATVTEKWPSWGSGGRKWTTDKKMQSDRNLYASDPKNNILRRPPVNGDRNSIYIALDKNNQVIVFLDPQGIPWAYDEDISQRLRTDSHEFYSKTKCPNPKSTNKRHVSQYAHLKDNPAIKPWWCGSDHYGRSYFPNPLYLCSSQLGAPIHYRGTPMLHLKSIVLT